MDTGPDFELLKDAYAIVDGIPESAISLDKLQSTPGESLEHGMVCSPAGWLALHPQFRSLGLSLSDDGSCLIDRDIGGPAPTAEVMGRLFRLHPTEASHLFGDRNRYTLGDDSGLSDKRLWLLEVREFLKRHQQIDPGFEERLETRGPFAESANPSEIRAL